MNRLKLSYFKLLELEHRPIFEHYLKEIKGLSSCEYNFRSLFVWKDSFPVKWAELNSRLLIYEEDEDYLLMPLGEKISASQLRNISEVFIASGLSGRYSFLREEDVEGIPGLDEFFKIHKNEGFGDYIYLSEKLATLRGPLSKKKNLVSQFRRNNPNYKCVAPDKDMLLDCFCLAKEWAAAHGELSLTMKQELLALSRCLKYFEELSFEALTLVDEGRLIAFSIFAPHDAKSYIINFEKSVANAKGSSQTINMEAALRIKNKGQYINREQDLGIPGLRKAKMSYYPDVFLNSYSLEPLL